MGSRSQQIADKGLDRTVWTTALVRYHGQVKWITACLLLLSGIVSGQQVQNPDDPDSVYRELSAKLRKGDLSVDFQALRFACSAARDCEVRGNVTDLAAEAEASKRKDWATARKICEKLLDRGYADVEIHADLTGIFNELDDLKSMRFHRDIVVGLLGSIRKKKGDSKESAMEVIKPSRNLLCIGFDAIALLWSVR